MGECKDMTVFGCFVPFEGEQLMLGYSRRPKVQIAVLFLAVILNQKRRSL